MFYSHEILTNRKYGVATVWLVATLGAKSNTKKVTRKAILDVNVQKACETIMEPEAPMALRLQGNLLYGVSRVYSQQVGYVLADTQTAQNTVRALMKTSRDNELDPEAGKARPNQLILMDDPAFIPNMELPPFDFDLTQLEREIAGAGNSQQSLMSPDTRRSSNASVSQHSATLPLISLPSSSNSGAGPYQLPFDDPFSEPSAAKQFGGTGRLFPDEEENMFEDLNLDFEIGPDGIMQDVAEGELQARRVASTTFPGRLGSNSAASARVRKEHEDAVAGLNEPLINADGNVGMQHFDDDLQTLPDAAPFSIMFGENLYAPSGGRVVRAPLSTHLSSSESSAQAPQRARKQRKAKLVPVDQQLEHPNSDLRSWQSDYLDNMAKLIAGQKAHQKSRQAKKAAYQYVWGQGLGGVGNVIGSSGLQGPLAAMFSGDALLKCLTGQVTSFKASAPHRGAKRSLEEVASDTEDNEIRRVRARQEEEELGRGVNMSFYNEGDTYMHGAHEDSSGIEMGRDAPSILKDHPASSNMPWNISASLHSYQRGQSSSVARHGSQIASTLGVGGRRSIVPSSPLIGRGSNMPGQLEHFSQLQDENLPIQFGREEEEDNPDQTSNAFLKSNQLNSNLNPLSSSQVQAALQEQEFELFGAAAGVDTQTAGSSQWVRSALDIESNNFFDYVRNSIFEKSNHFDKDVDEDEDELQADEERTGREYVSFEELFDPTQNSKIVAAQAFYHVLNLATRRRVWAKQFDAEDREGNLAGEIRIGVVRGAGVVA